MKNGLLGLHCIIRDVCQQLNMEEIHGLVSYTKRDFITFKLSFPGEGLIMSMDFYIKEVEEVSKEDLVKFIVMQYKSKDCGYISNLLH